jgi:SAM-dependent methyltransferase
MTIQIDRSTAQGMAPRFDEAMDLIQNEFGGCDAHRQYRNAFARLLKWDPLGRVLMLGTDQRDLFVPQLRRAIAELVPEGGAIFDFGCGDGQTLALAADAIPAGVTLSFEDPNPDYVERYRRFVESRPGLRIGAALATGFEELDETARRRGIALPENRSVDLGLALHMVFFLADLEGALARMVQFLVPGGALFIVFADERDGYTGHVLRAFIEAGGDTGANARHLAAIQERRRLLADPGAGGGAILGALRRAFPDERYRLDAVRQPSRLYGHSLADLIALSAISVLSQIEGTGKFASARRLLEERPEQVDLRIEEDGPRTGMLSVAQPQWISVIRSEPGF